MFIVNDLCSFSSSDTLAPPLYSVLKRERSAPKKFLLTLRRAMLKANNCLKVTV